MIDTTKIIQTFAYAALRSHGYEVSEIDGAPPEPTLGVSYLLDFTEEPDWLDRSLPVTLRMLCSSLVHADAKHDLTGVHCKQDEHGNYNLDVGYRK